MACMFAILTGGVAMCLEFVSAILPAIAEEPERLGTFLPSLNLQLMGILPQKWAV